MSIRTKSLRMKIMGVILTVAAGVPFSLGAQTPAPGTPPEGKVIRNSATGSAASVMAHQKPPPPPKQSGLVKSRNPGQEPTESEATGGARGKRSVDTLHTMRIRKSAAPPGSMMHDSTKHLDKNRGKSRK